MPGRGRGRGRGRGNNQSTIQSGTNIMLDVRESDTASISDFMASHAHLKLGDDTIGIFSEVVPSKLRTKSLNINTGKRLLKWEPDGPADTIGHLTFIEGGVQKCVKAFQKKMALLDPIAWIKDKERPREPFFWTIQEEDITAPENQGYVDCVASYMASKLRPTLKSPHFCDFYGCLRAVADVYLYNLEDDFEDFRFTKWFWAAVESNEIGLRIVEKSTGRRLTMEEIKVLSKPDDDFLQDESDDDSDGSDSSDSDSTSSEISAESLPCDIQHVIVDAAITGNESPKTVDSLSTASGDNESDVSFAEEYEIHAELYGMPVAVQYLEYCEGTIDEFLENPDFAPIVKESQELEWSAWLFQICAALAQLQNILRLTHNDLHSCNVLWRKTEQEFVFYHDSKGRKWKVPTFGYIFSIIDYGRAIFALNNFFIVSSDYNEGHDAYGMYNFGPILDESFPRVSPNKNFDLSRLASSLLRGLFPRNPAPKTTKSQLITKEGSWEVRETEHPVFNSLWTWLKTKSGENILEKQNGEEKYPGFDLYTVIAKEVGDALPESQFNKAQMFESFLCKTEKVEAPFWIQLPL